MGDIETLRVLIPVVVLAGAMAVALMARVVASRRPRRRALEGLDPGVVLFTSQRCPGCDPVRSRMIEALGPEGFREIRWTEDPQLFVTHMIDRVPTAAAVDQNGMGLIWEGMPSLRRLQRWKSLV